jgi:diphthamide biosynthesis protein 4
MASQTHYQVLCVPTTSTVEELRAAYHSRALACHPDKPGGSASAFQALQLAWEVVSDPAQRSAYDAELAAAAAVAARATQAAAVALCEEVPVAELQREGEGEGGGAAWAYPCRCGDKFTATQALIDSRVELVNCSGCSLNIRIKY